jgi:hypothetical protein
LVDQPQDHNSAAVKKFFAIASKSTQKELGIMHGILSTFLQAGEDQKATQNSHVAPATTDAHLKAKSA